MRYTSASTKYTFEHSFTPYEEARIRAALHPLDDALTAVGEAVLKDYERADTVWHISRENPILCTVKATNMVMGVDICGDSADHLFKKIRLVTEMIRRCGRVEPSTGSRLRDARDYDKEDRESIRPARKSHGTPLHGTGKP